MSLRRALRCLFAFVIIFAPAPRLRSQEKTVTPVASPTPTPKQHEEQEQIKVFTEEVRLPVFAFDDGGRFDPSVELRDILVLEDGVPQEIKSVRRIPASVLLMLGTGGETNTMMRTNTTRAVALNLVSSLRAGDQLSVIQFSSSTELLQNWTTDKPQVEHTLRTKLHSGRGSHLAAAIIEAARQLQSQPMGNRHVVIVTDGVDMSSRADAKEAIKAISVSGAAAKSSRAEFTEAIKQLNAAQATVHVISYTALMRQSIEKRSRAVKGGDGVQRDTNPGSDPVANGDPTLPPGMTRTPSFKIGSINTDLAMRRKLKDYVKATKESEQRLTSIAEEMGGRIWLPLSTDEMIAQGDQAAHEIGAQYVITYTPKRPLMNASAGEYRRIRVASRRVGLILRSRRGYVVMTPA